MNKFEDWDCLKDCDLEDRECSFCENGWNAAIKEAKATILPKLEKAIVLFQKADCEIRNDYRIEAYDILHEIRKELYDA